MTSKDTRIVATTIAAVGIVFGDLGTSPLYALQECFTGPHGITPNRENIIGTLSLIFWSLILVVTVKYLVFLMRADNRGEGGIMALLSLIPENVLQRKPESLGFIAICGIAGAALLFGDGVLTPAISVLSAVEGIGVAAPSLKHFIVPVTLLILVALFAIQSRGTGRLGALFGPVMVLWFLTAAGLGIVNIRNDVSVFQSLSPLPGLSLLLRHRMQGLHLLGGVVLVITGCEALYADMGHFGRRPIRLAWVLLCLPSLMLCYLGQGALLLQHPEAASGPFYALCPKGLWIYPLIALATAATVIASQALISGVFSLTQQAMRLGYFPRVTIVHTSHETEGQIYVPLMNTGLAISCCLLVLIFRESSKLTAAYGLAVSGTMLLTSLVFYAMLRTSWQWPKWKALLLVGAFIAIDAPFVVANTLKLFDGGYIPLVIGVGFVVVMASWRIGRSLLAESIRVRADEPFLRALATERRISGVGVVLASQPGGYPPVFRMLVARLHALYEDTVLLTVHTEHVPVVDGANRVEIATSQDELHRVIVRYGYTESPNVPAVIDRVLLQLNINATAKDVIYVLGRETVVATAKGKMNLTLERVFAVLARNSRNATDYFSIPIEQVLELGSQVDL